MRFAELLVVGVVEEHARRPRQHHARERARNRRTRPARTILRRERVPEPGEHRIGTPDAGDTRSQTAVERGFDRVAENHIGAYPAEQADDIAHGVQIREDAGPRTLECQRIKRDAATL